MDKIDMKIVHLLQQNSRISMSDISSCVNLSISAVSERLKKLESSGFIKQFTTIINPAHINKNLMVIMFVSLERSQYSNKFLDYVHNEKDILECHFIAGTYDYCLKILTNTTFTLQSILNNLKSLPGIRKTETNVILSTYKNNYSVEPTLNE